MIVFKMATKSINVGTSATEIVPANPDRVYVELSGNSGTVAWLGGDDVAVGNYPMSSSDQPLKMSDKAATAAIYGITSSGTSSVRALEVAAECD